MKQCPHCHNEVFDVANLLIDKRELLFEEFYADDWACFVCLKILWDEEIVPICPVCAEKGKCTTHCPETNVHICTFEEYWHCPFCGRQLLEDI